MAEVKSYMIKEERNVDDIVSNINKEADAINAKYKNLIIETKLPK